MPQRLIARLIADGHKPISVICVRKSWLRETLGYIERHGVRGSCHKILQVLRLQSWPGSDHWAEMAGYAQEHGLCDWRAPLPWICRKHDIDFACVNNLNADRTVEYVKQNQVDLLLNAGGELFRKNIIAAPTHGVFNVHKGCLPAYRGYNVVEWSLLNRHQVGVTLHFVNAGLDTGDVVEVVPIPVEANDSVASIRARSYPLQVDVMARGVRRLVAGELERTPQTTATGRQYFSMHPRLKTVTANRVGRGLNKGSVLSTEY